MRISVCQLPDPGPSFEASWALLCGHCREQLPDLVLLPELPFSNWIASRLPADEKTWQRAVADHEVWLTRLGELGARSVVGTRPIGSGEGRRNEVFSYEDGEIRPLHRKVHLPNEEGFWEASWYGSGTEPSRPFEVAGQRAGALVCTEIWFGEDARALGEQGIHLLLAPRATAGYSADKWVAGGRVAAVVSGAFCLSSNRGGTDQQGTRWAGQAWIMHPEEGDLLALTNDDEPFATVEIDPEDAERARLTYPRYVRDGKGGRRMKPEGD